MHQRRMLRAQLCWQGVRVGRVQWLLRHVRERFGVRCRDGAMQAGSVLRQRYVRSWRDLQQLQHGLCVPGRSELHQRRDVLHAAVQRQIVRRGHLWRSMPARLRDRAHLRNRFSMPWLRQRRVRDDGELSELRGRLQVQRRRGLLQRRVLRQAVRRQELRP